MSLRPATATTAAIATFLACSWLFSAAFCGHIIWACSNSNLKPLVFEIGINLYAVESLLVVVPAFQFKTPLHALPSEQCENTKDFLRRCISSQLDCYSAAFIINSITNVL